GGTGAGRRATTLPELLAGAAKPLADDIEKRVTRFVFRFVEKPGFRLAGAEEAAAQLLAKVGHVLEHYEGLAYDLGARTEHAFTRLSELFMSLQMAGGRRTGALTPQVMELLRTYPKERYQ